MKNKKCDHKNNGMANEMYQICNDCGAYRYWDKKNKKWFVWVEKVNAIEEDFL